VDATKGIWLRFVEARLLGLAAQMAFWLFLALIPLAAVGGLVIARIAVARQDLAATMLAPAVRDMVAAQLGQVAKWNGGTVGPLAVVVFAWLASSGIHSVLDVLEVQSGVGRPWWMKRVLALGACVALSLGIAVLALLSTGVGWLFRLVGATSPHAAMEWESSQLIAGARFVLGLVTALGLVAALYAAGSPRLGNRHTAIIPGAVLAVALQATSAFGYGLYIRLVGSGNAYQAGLGIIGVTLMSIYFFCLALLIGAEVNRAISDPLGARNESMRSRPAQGFPPRPS
jgi:membrane protein